MALNGGAAVRRSRQQKTNVFGTCLETVWEWFGSPHTVGRQPGRSFATAMDSYHYTIKRHPGDYNPPAGVPVWFGVSPTRTDANKAAGDVGVSVGGGRARFTDAGQIGVVGEMTIRQRAAEISRPYLGWTEDFGGNPIDWPGKTKPAPKPKPVAPATTTTWNGNEMTGFVRKMSNGEVAIVDSDTGKKRPLHKPEWLGYEANGAQFADLSDTDYDSIPTA